MAKKTLLAALAAPPSSKSRPGGAPSPRSALNPSKGLSCEPRLEVGVAQGEWALNPPVDALRTSISRYPSVAVTLTCRLYREGKPTELQFDPGEISKVIREPGSLVWLDVQEPTERSLALLGEEFGFHELALEDCLHPHQRPKIEQYDSYFFLVAYGIEIEGEDLLEHEIGMFVGRNYLVTVRKPPAWDLSPVLKRWDARSDLLGEGGGFLLYLLLDQVVDEYFDALDGYEDRTEAIEERVLAGDAGNQTQTDIFHARRNLLKLRRALAPLREVLDVLQRPNVEVVTPPLEPYYRDVYDHVLRATDFIDTLREVLGAAFDAHLSLVSNNMNQVMKKLTSWAAIILVPTLIAGIYGMNFARMPELRWRFGYLWALGLMVASALVLYRVFKRRDWF